MNEHDTDGPGPDEETIFADLRRAMAGSDPVPAAVVAAAEASLTWRRVDAELAELVYDSVVDPALARSSRGRRLLTFETPELTVEVEVGPVSLHGQIVPPQSAQVEVRHRGGSLTVTADNLGHFLVDHVPRGPVSFRCKPDAGSATTNTSWVIL